jgi:hypothetical protein
VCENCELWNLQKLKHLELCLGGLQFELKFPNVLCKHLTVMNLFIDFHILSVVHSVLISYWHVISLKNSECR